ncbi:unnamed protein product [Dimorphilus gyrociliatus]|uniref:Uncharacterized protein n=1 Tax=Dimorphilus gyrociliatus TaxID=2664684 RepID=A0A7I8VMH8_9ANNE|nr:unnamed protein product [Dimorphilus gyrociliatus]
MSSQNIDSVNLSLDNKKDTISTKSDSDNSQEGALILGKKNQLGVKYHTRYIVERKEQNHESFRESLEEFFFPCFAEEIKEHSIFKKIATFLTSEPFILTIHLTAVLLGVLKILLEVREKNGETIEEAHSALECIGVCFVIGLRAWVVNNCFHEIKTLRLNLEKADKTETIRGQKLKIFVRVYIFTMIMFCLISIGCTIAFKLLAHLGWTILSNNCLLALGTGLYGVAESFTGRKKSKISEDHHKMLIHEMSLLLVETQLCQTQEERRTFARKVENFLKALKETPEFSKPQYVKCSQKAAIRESSMMQIISYV